jgi:hypothetical protein
MWRTKCLIAPNKARSQSVSGEKPDSMVNAATAQAKLLVRERPRREAYNAERADRLTAAHHGHDRDRPVAACKEVPAASCKFSERFPDVGNVHDLAIENGVAVHVLPREGVWKSAPPRFGASGIGFGDGRGLDYVTAPERDADGGVRKELQAALNYGVEHRLGIGGRVADDAQNLGSCGLLLQRFVEIARATVELFLQVGNGYVCGWRFASLGPNGAVASTLHRLSACSTAPSHCLPLGSGHGIVTVQTSTPEGAGCEFRHRSVKHG